MATQLTLAMLQKLGGETPHAAITKVAISPLLPIQIRNNFSKHEKIIQLYIYILHYILYSW
jgi:hypothetical protein